MIAAVAIIGGYASLVWAFGWPGFLAAGVHAAVLLLLAAFPRS